MRLSTINLGEASFITLSKDDQLEEYVRRKRQQHRQFRKHDFLNAEARSKIVEDTIDTLLDELEQPAPVSSVASAKTQKAKLISKLTQEKQQIEHELFAKYLTGRESRQLQIEGLHCRSVGKGLALIEQGREYLRRQPLTWKSGSPRQQHDDFLNKDRYRNFYENTFDGRYRPNAQQMRLYEVNTAQLMRFDMAKLYESYLKQKQKRFPKHIAQLIKKDH